VAGRPYWRAMTTNIVTVDVREDLKAGRQPCGRIMEAVAGLRPDQALRLLVPFEPVPLYGVLGARGLRHTTRVLPDGDFEVLFTWDQEGASGPAGFDPESQAGARCGCGCSEGAGAVPEPLELDLRGLAPPEPMTRILEVLPHLPPGGVLTARTDRQPMHLYPLLARRGFHARTDSLPDGSFLTTITATGGG